MRHPPLDIISEEGSVGDRERTLHRLNFSNLALHIHDLRSSKGANYIFLPKGRTSDVPSELRILGMPIYKFHIAASLPSQ